jgi:hypothetical protein
VTAASPVHEEIPARAVNLDRVDIQAIIRAMEVQAVQSSIDHALGSLKNLIKPFEGFYQP